MTLRNLIGYVFFSFFKSFISNKIMSVKDNEKFLLKCKNYSEENTSNNYSICI